MEDVEVKNRKIVLTTNDFLTKVSKGYLYITWIRVAQEAFC